MKTKSVVIVILLACVGLFVATLGCCSGIVFFTYRSYRDTEAAVSPRVDGMFSAIENDSFGDTYVRDTAPELQRITTREQYEQIGQAIKSRLGALRSKRMVRFNARQWNANTYVDVVYGATFEKGAGTIRATLKKTEGDWLFVQFHVDSPEFQKDLASATCPKCGKPHTASAAFCPACGAALTPDIKQ